MTEALPAPSYPVDATALMMDGNAIRSSLAALSDRAAHPLFARLNSEHGHEERWRDVICRSSQSSIM
jgi:hypothetical protein